MRDKDSDNKVKFICIICITGLRGFDTSHRFTFVLLNRSWRLIIACLGNIELQRDFFHLPPKNIFSKKLITTNA